MCTGTHPFIPAPNTARVRLVYTLYGQTVMNVFHFTKEGGWDQTSIDDLVSEVETSWTANLKPVIADQATLQYIEGTDVSAEPGVQATLSVGVAGNRGTTALPGGSTIAIKFASGLTGRSSRGRMYFIGLGKEDLSGDNISSALATAILSGVTTFFADIAVAVPCTHVIVSYCNEGAWRTTATTVPVQFYLLTDNAVDSQRRRLAGRGM